MTIETENTGCHGNVIVGTRSSPKNIIFKGSLKEINVISDCLLIARKAWNRLVIFQQREIASCKFKISCMFHKEVMVLYNEGCLGKP